MIAKTNNQVGELVDRSERQFLYIILAFCGISLEVTLDRHRHSSWIIVNDVTWSINWVDYVCEWSVRISPDVRNSRGTREKEIHRLTGVAGELLLEGSGKALGTRQVRKTGEQATQSRGDVRSVFVFRAVRRLFGSSRPRTLHLSSRIHNRVCSSVIFFMRFKASESLRGRIYDYDKFGFMVSKRKGVVFFGIMFWTACN